MNHCIKIKYCVAIVMVVGCFSGCQYTTSTPRDHNALFDFSQRPRFFGGSGVQTPPATLPQLAGVQPNFRAPQLPPSGSAARAPFRPLGGLFASLGGNNSAATNRAGGLGVPNFEQSNTAANGGSAARNLNGFSQNAELTAMAGEVSQLTQRLSATDSDNQLLNTEMAGLRQKLELANQYNQMLKEQLADTSGRIQQTELEKQQALAQAQQIQQRMQQAAASERSSYANQFSQASSGFNRDSSGSANRNQFNDQPAGGVDRFASRDSSNGRGEVQFASATIRANNSLIRRLSEIQIPGGEARMDGDVIRIEFPSDRLFVPGTYQVTPAQRPLLGEVVATIRRSFPRQIVGVEAHWDNTPLNPPGTTDHQLTATQSLAVFEELIRLGLPRRQLFTMAMASNRPRHAAGRRGNVSPNRRIEVVIYPESYDGS